MTSFMPFTSHIMVHGIDMIILLTIRSRDLYARSGLDRYGVTSQDLILLRLMHAAMNYLGSAL
ncbi:hypothetical protein AC579_6381 [Pseudocercospora musae]|uniref:Uncharacterized protein n=1 Tax=Pseudocercospora musae TaxID=113226 RepID=A0A139IIY8_9PEZI|nr:hypothetical protein AC579_6381 [Pseudocercospora musae]KXT14724.1 hypothetical protein AC579_6381 [Pseudocercospora musae]